MQAQATAVAEAQAEDTGHKLDYNDLVVRGGVADKNQLIQGYREHHQVPGLWGFLVQYPPGKTLAELIKAGNFPNRQVSVTTVGKLLQVGVVVVPSPGVGYHGTAVAIPGGKPLDPERATGISAVFRVFPNPYPAPRQR